PGSDLAGSSREAFVVRPLVKPPLQTRGGNFQRVGRVNEIFDVENGANVKAHFGTILVSYPVWLVNKDADDWLVFRSSDFGVHQLQPMVDCYSLSNLLHPLFNRTRAHVPSDASENPSPKRKSGREPTGRYRRASSKP